MEVNYGIEVTNKFSLFFDDDEADPLEVLKQQLASLESSKQKSTNKNANKKEVGKENKVNAKPSAPPVTKKPTTDSRKSETKPKKDEVEVVKKGITNRNASIPDRNASNFRENKSQLPPAAKFPSDRQQQHSSPSDEDLAGFKEKTPRGFRQQKSENGDGSHAANGPSLRGGDVQGGGYARGNNAGFGGGSDNRGRGGFNRRGVGRMGGGGGVSFESKGKREFERHSGNDRGGIRNQEKRDGAGAYNWGNPTDLIEDGVQDKSTEEEKDQSLASVNEDGTKINEEKKENADETQEGEGKEPEEEKVLTLDEWKALEENKRLKADFNIRKPGEGCQVDAQWKKMIVLKKKADEEDEEEEDYEEDDVYVHKQKNLLPIEIKFNSAATTRRGGNRGGRGRGQVPRVVANGVRPGFDGRARKQQAPNVDDEKDFPSL